jgi:hypothetical protein
MRSILVLSLVSALLITPGHAQDRPREKAFKGMELYSWTNSSGEWVYALMPGTNREKTAAEIQNVKYVIPNISALEKRFSRLAVGEQVYWYAGFNDFPYPDKEIVNGVTLSAKKAQIELHLPQKNERKA